MTYLEVATFLLKSLLLSSKEIGPSKPSKPELLLFVEELGRELHKYLCLHAPKYCDRCYGTTMSYHSTLGALFVGNIFAAILYGITCFQALIYYQRCSEDSRSFKALICFLWLLDTIHMALITYGLYFYLISSFGDVHALLIPSWSLLAQVYITTVSDSIIRGIFARRVWLITGRKNTLLAFIAILSLFAFAALFGFATRAFKAQTFANFTRLSFYLDIAFATAFVADVLIATTLCITFSKNINGNPRTDSLLSVLIAYTVNTNVLTTMCSLACLVTFLVWPGNLVYLGIYFSLSKLYLNSLLAMLNARRSLILKYASGSLQFEMHT